MGSRPPSYSLLSMQQYMTGMGCTSLASSPPWGHLSPMCPVEHYLDYLVSPSPHCCPPHFLVVVLLIPPHRCPPHSSSLSPSFLLIVFLLTPPPYPHILIVVLLVPPHCCPPHSISVVVSYQQCCFLLAMAMLFTTGDVVYYRRCCLLSTVIPCICVISSLIATSVGLP